jgi:hypothetical protein
MGNERRTTAPDFSTDLAAFHRALTEKIKRQRAASAVQVKKSKFAVPCFKQAVENETCDARFERAACVLNGWDDLATL